MQGNHCLIKAVIAKYVCGGVYISVSYSFESDRSGKTYRLLTNSVLTELTLEWCKLLVRDHYPLC